MNFKIVPLRDVSRTTQQWIRSAAITCMLPVLAMAAMPALAQSGIPLTLAEAEELALDAEPGHEMLLARAQALDEQSIAASSLPDPQFRAGLLNYPVESGGFSTEAMTQAQLGLRQMFPPGDTRALSTRRYTLLADETTETANARHRDVLVAVRHAWYEARYWHEAHDTVTATRPLFADLLTVTRAMYSSGRGNQQDVLSAELELSRIDDRLLAISEQQSRARATLSEWIGDAARRPLAEAHPAMDRMPPLAELHPALESHPALAAAQARIDAQNAEVGLAEERFKPGWAVDLAYGYRDGLMPDGAPRSDFVSLTVTVDLPMLRKSRRDSSLRAALSERRAADAAKEQTARQMKSRLDAEYVRWQQLGRRIELYETTMLPQAEDRAQAALLAYQSETADFADVMRGRIDALTVQLETARLRIERGQSRAVLANLGGLSR